MATRPLTDRETNARQVLKALMGVMGTKDSELAQRITDSGARRLSRSAVQQRREGQKPLDFRDIEELATALSVPPSLFDEEPIDAVRWVLDNRPDLAKGLTGCSFSLAA